MKSKNTIQQIENAYNAISGICEENIYDEQNLYHKTYEKIKNASSILLNNAMRLSRGQSSLIKSTNKILTIQDINTLMFKIYQILSSVEFSQTKEAEISKCISECNLNPKDILVLTPSREEQCVKIQALLNNL